MEDQEILGLLEKRSEQALGEVERYGALCLGLARRLLGRAEDAEECVNDAYLRLWNAVPPAKPQSLRAYLCRIVRNLALRRLDRQGAQCRGGESYALALEELEHRGGADALALAGRSVSGEADGTALIAEEQAIPTWRPRSYLTEETPVGKPYRWNGQVYRL